MKRHLSNLLSWLSLILCLGSLGLWARGWRAARGANTSAELFPELSFWTPSPWRVEPLWLTKRVTGDTAWWAGAGEETLVLVIGRASPHYDSKVPPGSSQERPLPGLSIQRFRNGYQADT